jgi:hypothetical protein
MLLMYSTSRSKFQEVTVLDYSFDITMNVLAHKSRPVGGEGQEYAVPNLGRI